MNVYEIITQKIVQKLEDAEKNGITHYWVCPWSGGPKVPVSYGTSNAYHGINRLLLTPDEYITFNMVNDLNKANGSDYHIRKGASSHICVYCGKMAVKDEETGEPVIDDFTGEPLERMYVKYYRVFSRQDIIDKSGVDLPSKFPFAKYDHTEQIESQKTAFERFLQLTKTYCAKYGIKLEVVQDGTRAYYRPADDTIRVPDISNFTSLYEYVSTVAHELCHSTMKPLGRYDEEKSVADMENYSKEELVAEIGAEMLMQELGIMDDRKNKDNSIAYLQGWAKYLKNKTKEIISAASKSESAVALILNEERELTKESIRVKSPEAEEER